MSLHSAPATILAAFSFVLLGACIPANIAELPSSTDESHGTGGSGATGSGATGSGATGSGATSSGASSGGSSFKVSQISTGAFHTCAVLLDGRVKCWGWGYLGQLGLGDTSDRGDKSNEMGAKLPAVDLGTNKKAVAVSAGMSHTCALLEGGSIKCWGEAGLLGLGDMSSHGIAPNQMGDNLPAVDLGSGKKATAVSAGHSHTCALLDDGSVKCWGLNNVGELGLGDTFNRGDGPNEMGDQLPAVNLGSGKKATALSVGEGHTCALLDDGSVKCWGANGAGELGLGDKLHRGDGPNEMGDNLPAVDLGSGQRAVALSGSDVYTCARLADKSLKCWGADKTFGGLGLGSTTPRGDGPNEMGDNLPAVDLGTGETAAAVCGGLQLHTCAVLQSGEVKCWGANDHGALGLGDTVNRGNAPQQMGDNLPAVDLGSGKRATALSCGWFHTCALLNDGEVKCWGANDYGDLGLGNTSSHGGEPNEMGDNLPPVNL